MPGTLIGDRGPSLELTTLVIIKFASYMYLRVLISSASFWTFDFFVLSLESRLYLSASLVIFVVSVAALMGYEFLTTAVSI